MAGRHFRDDVKFVPVYIPQSSLEALTFAAEQKGMGHLTVSEVVENAMSIAVDDWSLDFHIPRKIYTGRGK